MKFNNQKGITSTILVFFIIVVIMAAAITIILTNPKFLNKLYPKNTTNQTNITPQPSPSSSTELQQTTHKPSPTVSQTQEIVGILIIVYGDPKPGTGDDQPRYKYSVTDDTGKTTSITIDPNTKYIGGTSFSDFDRKKVKVTGTFDLNSSVLKALSIEIV